MIRTQKELEVIVKTTTFCCRSELITFGPVSYGPFSNERIVICKAYQTNNLSPLRKKTLIIYKNNLLNRIF